MWIVILQELFGQNPDYRSNLSKFIVSWITSREKGVVVYEVQVAGYLKETIPVNPVSDRTILDKLDPTFNNQRELVSG